MQRRLRCRRVLAEQPIKCPNEAIDNAGLRQLIDGEARIRVEQHGVRTLQMGRQFGYSAQIGKQLKQPRVRDLLAKRL